MENDLDDLAHHDSPRPPLADRPHDMLQRQIDALLTHARTVTHQIADLTVRAQRMDAELATSNRAVTALAETVSAHMASTDKRATAMERRMDEFSAGQTQILSAVNASAEVLQQVRDARTTSRVMAGLLRGTSGVVVALGVLFGALYAVVRYLATFQPPA